MVTCMAGKKQQEIKLGGSIFWILMILAAIVGVSYLGIWSFHNNSVQGVAISAIFFALIISGVILSRFEIFNSGTWSENAFSFTLGFSIYSLIGIFADSSTKSVLSITKNSLFATISSELPLFFEFIMNVFVIPIAEESFWMIGIPFATITIMNLIGERFSIFKNLVFQLIVITILTGVSFALFHVGKLLLGFLIAAFFFRAIMVWSVVGDADFDWIKGISLVPAFAVGAHIGNNWADYGFGKGMQLLTSNFEVGVFILIFLGIIFISFINQLIIWLTHKKIGVRA